MWIRHIHQKLCDVNEMSMSLEKFVTRRPADGSLILVKMHDTKIKRVNFSLVKLLTIGISKIIFVAFQILFTTLKGKKNVNDHYLVVFLKKNNNRKNKKNL